MKKIPWHQKKIIFDPDSVGVNTETINFVIEIKVYHEIIMEVLFDK